MRLLRAFLAAGIALAPLGAQSASYAPVISKGSGAPLQPITSANQINIPGGGTQTPQATPATNEIGYAGSPIDTQSGDYTIVLADIGKTVIETSSSAQTFTIDKNANKAYAAGFLFDVLNTGTGTLTVTATSPATITQEGSGVTGNITVAPHARVKFQNVGTDLWDVVTAPGCAVISAQTPSGSGVVTFSSIASGYRDLKIVGNGASTASAANESVGIQLNSDTGSNYDFSAVNSNGSTAQASSTAAGTSATIGNVTAATGPSGASGYFLIYLPAYTNTTFQKTGNSDYGIKTTTATSGLFSVHGTFWWRNTGAVTAISLTLAAGNWTSGSAVTLYGCN